MAYPRRILLTGAAGSIGGQVMAELLARPDTIVSCVVRAQDSAAARARVQTRLAATGVSPDALRGRLVAVAGDLLLPRFGLPAAGYDGLAESVESIVHCAAHVDLAASYDQARGTNLVATVSIMDFARRSGSLSGRIPEIHHVSTLGTVLEAAGTDGTAVDERAVAGPDRCGPSGYARTKAEAEQALRAGEASEGIPVTIHRPGVVTADSRDGRPIVKDVLTPFLWAVAALGKYPKGFPALAVERIDVLAGALVALMGPESAGRTFHLIHPEPVPVEAFVAGLARQTGRLLQPVAPDDWHALLLKDAGAGSEPLRAMGSALPYLLADGGWRTGPGWRADATWEALAAQGIRPLPFDEPYFDRLAARFARRTGPR